jgi:hypothetical protein
MTDAEKIDWALKRMRVPENAEIARQQDAPKAERTPPPRYRQELEREGRSEWSGGSWGGRSR